MLRIPGKQGNTSKYFYRSYSYYLDPRGSGTIFRYCAKNSLACSARIYVNNINDLPEILEVVGDHNHDGDSNLYLKHQFLMELENLASSTFDDLKAIYDRVRIQDV